eukprot:552990_1
MAADSNQQHKDSQSSKVEATLSAIDKMEESVQKLKDLNTVNTLQLMEKLNNEQIDEMDSIPENSLKNFKPMTASDYEYDYAIWQPPNPKQCALAATNPIPYTKNKFPVPSKTSIIGIITDSKYWNKFFTPKIPPTHGDWLHSKIKDRKGQTFMEYYNRKPKYPSNKLDTIGLITIGNFNITLDLINKSFKTSENNNKIETKINNNNSDDEKDYKQNDIVSTNNLFDMLSSIVQVYYGMKVEIIKPIKSDDITARHNNGTGAKQLLTTDIHEKLSVIKEQNAKLFCLMGVSIIDLYPKPSWNFVFGQARIKAGTGVFSFARYIPDFEQIKLLEYGIQSKDGDKIKLLKKLVDGEAIDNNILQTLEFDSKTQILFFRRCIKVLVHEIGHLFGIKHCVFFECIMNGSNHDQEADIKPVYLCPVCLHKLYFCRLKKCKKNKPNYKSYLETESKLKSQNLLSIDKILKIKHNITQSIWTKNEILTRVYDENSSNLDVKNHNLLDVEYEHQLLKSADWLSCQVLHNLKPTNLGGNPFKKRRKKSPFPTQIKPRNININNPLSNSISNNIQLQKQKESQTKFEKQVEMSLPHISNIMNDNNNNNNNVINIKQEKKEEKVLENNNIRVQQQLHPQ